MKLLLRKASLQARLEATPPRHIKDIKDTDYAVLDDGVKVGRIYGDTLHGSHQWGWTWSLHTWPAPPPNHGFEVTLKEAMAAFKARYEQFLKDQQAKSDQDSCE
jgi:hypothetical protein